MLRTPIDWETDDDIEKLGDTASGASYDPGDWNGCEMRLIFRVEIIVLAQSVDGLGCRPRQLGCVSTDLLRWNNGSRIS